MGNFNNFNVLEINLQDQPNSGMTVSAGKGATYEEAFLGGASEEMSNLKGKGRARRKKRKLQKIADKREIRTEKRKLKSDRQEERIARRQKRKAARQDIRDEQQEARQQRRRNIRDERQEAREAKNKRKMTSEEGDQERENYSQEQELMRRGREPEDEQVDETTAEDLDQDTGVDETDSESSADERGDGYYGDDVDSGQEDAGYDDDSSYDQYPTFEEEENFDGENSNFVSEVTGRKTNAPIDQICLKIEWNYEMMNRLAQQKKNMASKGQDTSRIDQAIDQKFQRNMALENQLQNFIGADGSRAKQVSMSKRMARRQKMLKVIPQEVMARMLNKGFSKSQIKEWWERQGHKRYQKFSGIDGWDGYPDVIQVENGNVDELINYGNEYKDSDREIAGLDAMSFFDGGEKSVGDNSWMKSLVVGIILGGVTIYMIRKYKLLS